MVASDQTALAAAPAVRRRVYWVRGSIGGVGKSTVAMPAIDCLRLASGTACSPTATRRIGDVSQAYRDEVPHEVYGPGQGNGWEHLANLRAASPASTVVFNTAARDNRAEIQPGAPP
ncbi:MAG TPA: hypothetical protein VG275_14400 [Solirubrobacteraceae bacterium]|jgi:hypothetical protein|nr:hypothetical protein [Solirubrobacteraceae bacterium]